MRQAEMRWAWLVAAALCGAAATPAAADGELGYFATLDATKTDDAGEATSRTLRFWGKTDGFPEGTRLDVRLALKGNEQFIGQFRTFVDSSESFKGESEEINRLFPPGSYTVHFILSMRDQTKDIQNWFVLNRGFAPDRGEILETVAIKLGSDADQTAFLDGCIDKLKAFLDRTKTVYLDLKDRIENSKPKEEGWKTKHNDYRRELYNIQLDINNWSGQYVTLPYEKLRRAFTGILVDTNKLLRGYNKEQKNYEYRIKNVDGELRTLEDALVPATAIPVPGGDAPPDSGD